MRFLANENFPGAAVAALEAAAHEIAWVRRIAPGVSDEVVLAWAARERRVLLTFDKDFGELARTSDLPIGCGIVLFRMPMPKAELLVCGWLNSSGRATTGRVIFRLSSLDEFECGRSDDGSAPLERDRENEISQEDRQNDRNTGAGA